MKSAQVQSETLKFVFVPERLGTITGHELRDFILLDVFFISVRSWGIVIANMIPETTRGLTQGA